MIFFGTIQFDSSVQKVVVRERVACVKVIERWRRQWQPRMSVALQISSNIVGPGKARSIVCRGILVNGVATIWDEKERQRKGIFYYYYNYIKFYEKRNAKKSGQRSDHQHLFGENTLRCTDGFPLKYMLKHSFIEHILEWWTRNNRYDAACQGSKLMALTCIRGQP